MLRRAKGMAKKLTTRKAVKNLVKKMGITKEEAKQYCKAVGDDLEMLTVLAALNA
jgi:hypothetical protein